MIYNFHTHTSRCGHASGNDEEYIKCAIEAGIKHLGFSDHAPFIFPDGFESNWRVPLSLAEDYVKDIDSLRKKYSDKIDIIIGFEMEYYEDHFDKMFNIARKCGAEYLILAQHFILGEHPNGIGSVGPTDNEDHLKHYIDEVIKGVRTGLFSYVAHPDLVCFTGNAQAYKREITRLCQASIELDIPLEINMLGIRNKKHYPADAFWKIVGETSAPVTIGFDAHNPSDFLDANQHIAADRLIREFGLNYIGMPRLRKI